MKKVLVIGSGGREHAIVRALSLSPQKPQIFCAPGNAGIALQATCVPIKDTAVDELVAFASREGISLVVVGPEAALAAGVADAMRAAGIPVFGHGAEATRIESSKEFAKQVMASAGVPTAGYRSFDNFDEALAYVAARPFPAVLKYDGLAAGKGVVIAADLAEAEAALRDMLLDAAFGEGRVVVEDWLEGPEFSFMAFVDGLRVYPMPLAQDHKRAYDGDKGPNTGGMGAYTHLPFITEEDREFALEHILRPVAAEMVRRGTPLCGVLYGGLMKTAQGVKVIEFNARFGDPETEVVLPLLDSDILDVFESVACGRELAPLNWSDDFTMGVVMASKGYPGKYEKGRAITLPEGYDFVHMGTGIKDGQLVTAGGRVLMSVARAATFEQAREQAYKAVEAVECDNLFWRRDIAHQVG